MMSDTSGESPATVDPEQVEHLPGTAELDAAHLRRTRIALVSAATAVIALVGGWTLAAAVQTNNFDPVRESISALAAVGTPQRWIMTTGLALTGLAHGVTAWALTPARRPGRIMLAVAGLATLAVAALPMADRYEGGAAHYVTAAVAFGALAIWPWLGARGEQGPTLLSPRIARPVSGFLIAAVLMIPLFQNTGFWGAYERAVAAAQALWPLLVAVSVWRWSGRPRWSALARGVLAWMLLTVAGFVGGVAATILVPVTVQTNYYQAKVTLSPDVAGPSRLHVPTVLGDLDLHFSGLAPGVVVGPQVKDSITELLARPALDVSQLQVSAAEVNAVTSAAARGLVLRFMIGALVAVAAGLLAYTVVRNHPPSGRLFGVSALAWLLVTIGTGVAMGNTYQVRRQTGLETTGVLTTVWANQNMLADVEARSVEVAPYVSNLLKLSAALQQKYTPTPTDSPVALRLALVSDIHDANQYAMLKTLIESESVDAVLDTGDLVTFGKSEEAQQAGLLTGIASLEVPYIFTRGNHDATSATDDRLLEVLAAVPNVVLLQPKAELYQRIDFGGISIAGFNDPRWFGDEGGRQIDVEHAARDRFAEAYADSLQAGTVDLVMSHEPWAVEGIKGAGVLVNGHMHIPDLVGNRVQAGTFTGGGPFSHYQGAASGEELVGQPSAFDLLTFGTTCRLTSLTRYRFSHVVEGRPTYDSVSLINGNIVDTRPVDPQRICTAGTAPVTERVSARELNPAPFPTN